MSRICGYAKTTTGYPCTQVVKDSRDHCEAGHPCPIVFDMATVTNRLPLANAMPMETDDFVLPRLHSRPAPSFLTAKYVLTEGSVFHVGTFDLSTKGAHGDLEGRGLSVSLVPDAWRSIARLGDARNGDSRKVLPDDFLTLWRYVHVALPWRSGVSSTDWSNSLKCGLSSGMTTNLMTRCPFCSRPRKRLSPSSLIATMLSH